MTPDLPDVPAPSADLIERARQFRDSGAAPSLPRLSATAVILRDVSDAVEVLLLRRAAHLGFAPGVHVFPGGVVDPADYAHGADVEAALTRAAIRETFEETGLLLATSVRTAIPTVAALDGASDFAEVIARNGVALRHDDLRAWAHWVTPEFEPRRYDTRFFVVAGDPHLGELRRLDAESDELAWVRPADALAAAEAGRWRLMPPTEHTLRELATFATTAQVVAAAADRRVERWLPTLDPDAEAPRFVITRLDPAR